MILLILTLLAIIQLTVGYNFTSIKDPAGAYLVKAHDTYISYNNWRFFYYYDLNDYYSDVETLTECMERMEVLCSKLADKSPCTVLMEKHKSIMSNIHIDIDYIKSIQTRRRKKRDAIFGSIATYIWKPIFGIMDEGDARDISERINDLLRHRQTHFLILEDNLSIMRRHIQATNISMEMFRNNIDHLHTYVDNVTQTISNVETEIKQHIDFKYLSSLATLITFEHERVTRIIKDTLKNTLRGEFTELITHDQLTKDIREVARELDDNSFIVMKRLKDIQDVVAIRGTVREKRMIVEISVPIISKTLFKLSRIVALPLRHQNKTVAIDIDNQYYLVNNETRIYIPILVNDLQTCKHLSNESLLCFPQTEMYFEDDRRCESNILFENFVNNPETLIDTCNYQQIADINYIKRLSENSYFAAIKEPVEVRENCVKTPTQFYTLNSTGIIRMNMNCEIILSGMKITTKNTKTREKITEIIKPHQYTLISVANITTLSTSFDKLKLQKVKYVGSTDDLTGMVDTIDKNVKMLHEAGVVQEMQNNVFKWNAVLMVVLIISLYGVKLIVNKIC